MAEQTMPRFEYISCLGHGSFGIVLKATYTDKNSFSAVKIIFPEKEKDIKNLKRECEMKGKSHKNVVNVYNFFETAFTNVSEFEEIENILRDDDDDDQKIHDLLAPFKNKLIRRKKNIPVVILQMELCGPTLREWLKQHENYKKDDLRFQSTQLEIIKDLINGMQFLHENKIIHRDFKPDNVMFSLSHEGNKFAFPMKIGDFGLCRILHSDKSRTKTLTSKVGTLDYRAPEMDENTYDFQSDIFSLGLVIWEVVQLIPSKGRQKLFKDLVYSNKTETICNCMPKFTSMIINMTKKDLESRIKTIKEVGDMLNEIPFEINEFAVESRFLPFRDWNARDIVKILLKDETLIKNKRGFGRFLNIPGYTIKEFDDVYNRETDLPSYFCNILDTWKSSSGNGATILALTKILRENGFVASSESLVDLPNCIPAPNLTIFGVKSPISNFVGREKELKKLNELFKKKKACVVLSSAMGGKGKTELCRRFIQQLPKDADTLVIWVSGDGHQQFHQSLSKIGQSMNILTTDPEGKPLSIEKIIENISIKRKSKWAVIIDNVDEEFSGFYKAVSVFLRNGAFVVVTSRRSDIQTEECIFLEDLENEDAFEFVRSELNETPEKLIIELCKSLQNYPLALQQAVAYIKLNQGSGDESYGIREYLVELNLDNSQVLDHEIPLTGYEHTIQRVFELTLSKILNVSSLTLLNILSLVQADGIETEFLKNLFSFFELEELFASSISTFKSFSLIGVNKGEVTVHRIVQKLTRGRMKSKNNFNLVVNQILENIDTDELFEEEIFHIIQVWNIALSESEIIKKNSNFAVKICSRLNELDLEEEWEEFSEITLEQFATFLEPDHIDTLRMKFQLGKALYKEGLVKLEEVWGKYKKVLGEEHEEALECAHQIAFVLEYLNRYDESLEWYERVLKSRVKVHGENHENTIRTKRDIIEVLGRQGKREEALTIWKQMLESNEKEFGHEDPRSLNARDDIAYCLYDQGKFVEAKKEYEELLELRVKVLGEDHADTLSTKYLLSFTLFSLGEKEKALEMMEQILISREKALGPNHFITTDIRDTISKWRLELGFL